LKNYTEIVVLLDRSGSMITIKDDMEGAYREFLKKHKETPSTRITLVQFDDRDDQDVVYERCKVGEAKALRLEPRGITPLVDAFVKLIDRTGERLRDLPERERPNQVVFVVITDGQENASKTYKRSDVFQRVTHQRERYGWDFIYLGANQDAIKEAHTYGIPALSTLSVGSSGIEAYSALQLLTNKSAFYAAENASLPVGRKSAATVKFTNEDRKKAKLDKPSNS